MLQKNDNKLVSIVLPIHNEALWLEECIASLAHQTYKNIELVLIDDCSVDNSYELAQSLKQKYPDTPIVVHQLQKKSRGDSAGRNKGIEISSGELIVQTDADTIFPTTFIERSLQYLKEHRTDGLSIGELRVHPKKTGALANYWRAKRKASFLMREQGKKDAVIGMYIFYRYVAEKLHNYTDDVPSSSDWDFALRAKEAGFTTMWAKDVHFYHADSTSPWKFFLRLLNNTRYNAPIEKRWGKWLSIHTQIKELIHGFIATALLLVGVLGIIEPVFFFGWLALFVLEGIAPLFLHTESRWIVKLCVQKKYINALFALPFITVLRVRASNYGKIYAILFPKKVSNALTFDV